MSPELEQALAAFRRIPECATAIQLGDRNFFNHVDVVFRLGGRDIRREADLLFQALFALVLQGGRQ